MRRVVLPSVNLASFEPILSIVIFCHLLLNLASDIDIILKHVEVDSLTFKEIHLEYCQVVIQVTLYYLPSIILKDFLGFWRFEPSNGVVLGCECWVVALA